LGRYRYRVAGSFQDSGLAILRPLDGAVFYRDPGLPAEKQQISIECTGTGRGELAVDGQVIHRGDFPFRAWFGLSPGSHSITLSGEGETISHGYEVH
jgi:hypothetical protein